MTNHGKYGIGRRLAFASAASALALMQACAVPAGTQGEEPLRARAEQPSAKPMPPAGYAVKWTTCTHFVEGEARILNNSRVVKIAADGTVPMMRVEPIDDSHDNVRRVLVAKLPYELLRGEGVMHEDAPLAAADVGALTSKATDAPATLRAAEEKVSFLKLGQVVVTKEPDGSVVQWVIASDNLGEPVRNERTGRLEYQDTCFRNRGIAGRDTEGFVTAGLELGTSCVVESMNERWNASSAYGYTPLCNYVTRMVPTGNDPSVHPHPDGANYHGYGLGGFQYSGTGAALNDLNGAERDASTQYFGGYTFCHMIVSGGLEVPGAKRPATKSLPLPGSINVATVILWRPVNPNVNIANDEEPVAPPFTPEAAPLEPAPQPALEAIEVEPIAAEPM